MPTRPRGGNRQNMQQGESVGTSSRTGVTCFGVLLLQAISVGAWQHPPCHVPAMRGNAGASARGAGNAGASVRGASRFLCPSLKSLTMLAGGADEQKTLRPVVLCPAQFGTAEDYDQLKNDLHTRGFALYPAPLRRFDWLRIVSLDYDQLKDFFTASLRPAKTLGFFYEALDKAFQQVEDDYGPDVKVSVLGHSIGGWVARSYIGEVMGPEVAARKICSLVTLGTPHNPPPEDSPVAALDQTRGLLTYINNMFPSGAPLPSSAVTCVAGKGTTSPVSVAALLQDAKAKLWDADTSRSLLLEEVVALSSYFPLSGAAFGTVGDGLIPVSTAVMEGCGKVELDDCNHAAFVPTAGRSLLLPETYKWYGSPGLIDLWVKYL